MGWKTYMAPLCTSALLASCVSNSTVSDNSNIKELESNEASNPESNSTGETPTVKPPPRRRDQSYSQTYDGPGLIERLETCDLDSKRYAAFAELAREQYRPGRIVLKFSEALSNGDHAAFDHASVVYEEYLGDNAYIFSLPKRAVDSIPIEKVECADFLLPTDKLTPRIHRYRQYEWSHLPNTDLVRVIISGFTDANNQDLRAAVSEVRGGDIVGRPPIDGFQFAVVPYSAMMQLASNYHIRNIDLGPEPFSPLNETGRNTVGSDMVQRPDPSGGNMAYDGLTGDGVKVGIFDSGIDENHQDFIDSNGAPRFYRSDTTRPIAGCPSSNDFCAHGTHVASIAAGNGRNSRARGFPGFSLRGHAPKASIGDYTLTNDPVDILSRIAEASLDDGTDVSNHSYIQNHTGEYTATTEILDRILYGSETHNGRRVPRTPQIWTSGNSGINAQNLAPMRGYYSILGPAKNTISVGSVDTLNERLSNFSSLGPTFDGRVKPDVMAPGCRNSIPATADGIMAAEVHSQDYIGPNWCGTSMAAPVVTGVVAQLMEQRGGAGALYPSTYKAVLANTADDMVKTAPYTDANVFNNPDTGEQVLHHAGPDFATGHGLIQAEYARRRLEDTDQWLEATLTRQGQRHEYCVNVPRGEQELKITLAWDDPPFTPKSDYKSTDAVLVNDLDLSLVSPNGVTLLPWVVDPLPRDANLGVGWQDPITTADVKPATRKTDRLNNLETVARFRPPAGQWRIRVDAHLLPMGLKNPQPYSLAFSHDRVACQPNGGGSNPPGGGIFGRPNSLDDYTITLLNDPYAGSVEGQPGVNRKATHEVYNGENLRTYYLCVVPDGDAATNETVRVTYNKTGNRADNKTVVIRETGAPKCARGEARYINLYMPGAGDAKVRIRRIYP